MKKKKKAIYLNTKRFYQFTQIS